MTETTEVPGTRDGVLKAAPILVYPHSHDQRDILKAAASAEGRNMSNFMVHAAVQFLANPKRTIQPTEPDGMKAPTMLIYPQSEDQREAFVEASKKLGLGKPNKGLSPFMIYAALTFIANKSKKK